MYDDLPQVFDAEWETQGRRYYNKRKYLPGQMPRQGFGKWDFWDPNDVRNRRYWTDRLTFCAIRNWAGRKTYRNEYNVSKCLPKPPDPPDP